MDGWLLCHCICGDHNCQIIQYLPLWGPDSKHIKHIVFQCLYLEWIFNSPWILESITLRRWIWNVYLGRTNPSVLHCITFGRLRGRPTKRKIPQLCPQPNMLKQCLLLLQLLCTKRDLFSNDRVENVLGDQIPQGRY